MELNIKEKKEQKLLSRLEVRGDISFDGPTPSNDVVKQAIAKKVGKDVKLIILKKIGTNYGSTSASIFAYVYDNEDKLKDVERIKEEKKEGEEESAPATEKPAEVSEKKEEAPKEE